MAGDNKTTLETDVEIKVKSDQLKDLQKQFKDLTKDISASVDNIDKLKNALSELAKKKQFMTGNAYSKEYNKLSSSLVSEKTKLQGNKELENLYKDEIKKLKDEITALENASKANKENTEATKKNTKAKNKETKATEDAARAEEKKAKEAERAAKLERDSQSYRMRAEATKTRADAELLRAKAAMVKAENTDRFQRFKRTPKYQTGRGFYSAGAYLGKNLPSPVGNTLSTGFQLVGSSLMNPSMGAAVAVSQLTKAITQLGTSSVKAFSEIESIRTQLGVVYGNQTQANQAFGELSSYAIKSPFGVQQTAELATLLKQSGVEASNLMDTLKMLGDTAGGNMEKMKRIANNYAQIVSIGKASMLDMRQFAYAGIPIFEKVAEELNVSQTALRKMISDGKVTSEVITKVFQDMTSEGGLFFEATSKGAETLKARFQNLKDIKQLALGGVGEILLRVGEKTGNDSIAYKAVSFSEDFYQKINKLSTLKNLEKSVHTIETNSSAKQRVQELIDYAKASGASPDIIKTLEKKIKDLDSQFSLDKQRSIYSSLYESYRGTEAVGRSMSDIRRLKLQENSNLENLDTQRNNRLAQIEYEREIGKVTEEQYQTQRKYIVEYYQAERALAKLRLNELDDESEILIKQQKITDEMRTAWAETQIIKGQQTAIDEITGNSTKSKSVLSDLATMTQYYQETEEYKKSEQENLIARLESSQALLEEIASHTEKGTKIINFGEVAGNKLTEYIKRGAVNGRKLATTADMENAGTDWKILQKQVAKARDAVKAFSQGSGAYEVNRKEIESMIEGLDGIENNKSIGSFYTDFNKRFYSASNYAFNRYLNATDTDTRNVWKNIYDTLMQSLLEYSSEGIAPEGWEEGVKKFGTVSQALWKRILSNATGISANLVNNSNSALTAYSSNISKRDMGSSVWGAMLGNGMSTKSLTSMLSYNGLLYNDGRNIAQVDWETTGKNLKNFAMQLSASTEVISAYNSAVEKELKTYEDLLTTGIWQTEYSEGNNKQRYISSKTAAKYMTDMGEQLVNVFGEAKLASGKEIEWDNELKSYVYKGTKNALAENEAFVITDEIFSFLEERITAKRSELAKGKLRETYNQLYGSLSNNQSNYALENLILSSSNGYSFSKLGEDNKSLLTKAIYDRLNLTGNGGFDSTEDLMKQLAKGNDKAIRAVKDAVKAVTGLNSELSTLSSEIKDSNEIEKEKNARAMALDIISGDFKETEKSLENGEPSKAKSLLYNVYWKEKISELGYGDIGSFASVADQVNSVKTEKRSDIQSLINSLERRRNWYENDSEGLDDLLRNSSLTDDEHKRVSDVNLLYEERIKLLKEIKEGYNDITVEEIKQLSSTELTNQSVKKLLDTFVDSSITSAMQSLIEPAKILGESMEITSGHLAISADYSDKLLASYKNIGAQLLSQMGAEMATCGFRIAGAQAMAGNIPGAIAGLALAAAGGFASGLGTALSSKKDKTKEEQEKLQNITDQIKELLKQARADALYYENNMRHQEALGKNKEFSYRSVNDALISTNGQIITTDPKDYLIATKNPKDLVSGGNVTVQPNITFKVENNANVNVKQEQRVSDNGTLEFVAVIEDIFDNYIASGRGDEAFSARAVRMNGSVAVR